MMKKDSALWLLSLARKAGKAEVGAFLSERAIKSRRTELIILASDCSENTRKKFINSSEFYGIKYIIYSDKSELARATGKENVSVVAVCDKNFASGIENSVAKTDNLN